MVNSIKYWLFCLIYAYNNKLLVVLTMIWGFITAHIVLLKQHIIQNLLQLCYMALLKSQLLFQQHNFVQTSKK